MATNNFIFSPPPRSEIIDLQNQLIGGQATATPQLLNGRWVEPSETVNLPNKKNKAVFSRQWSNWFDSVYQTIFNLLNVSNPSLLFNSDFHFVRNLNTVSSSDGDNVFFAERWQLNGANSGNYTVTQHVITGDNPSHTGSDYAIRLNISAFNGSHFYFYQRFDGSRHLRKWSDKNVAISVDCNNLSANKIKMCAQIDFYNGVTHETYSSPAQYSLQGENKFTLRIKTNSIKGKSMSAGAYVEVRLCFLNFENATGQLQLNSVKAEFGNVSTPLIIEHEIENSRIDNYGTV